MSRAIPIFGDNRRAAGHPLPAKCGFLSAPARTNRHLAPSLGAAQFDPPPHASHLPNARGLPAVQPSHAAHMAGPTRSSRGRAGRRHGLPRHRGRPLDRPGWGPARPPSPRCSWATPATFTPSPASPSSHGGLARPRCSALGTARPVDGAAVADRPDDADRPADPGSQGHTAVRGPRPTRRPGPHRGPFDRAALVSVRPRGGPQRCPRARRCSSASGPSLDRDVFDDLADPLDNARRADRQPADSGCGRTQGAGGLSATGRREPARPGARRSRSARRASCR